MAAWGGDPSFDMFQLPEEHQELRAAIRALAEKEIAARGGGRRGRPASRRRPSTR
jgi:hypothetical protein